MLALLYVLAQTDTATVLASALAAVLAGAVTTVVGGVVALKRIRAERAEAVERLDLDRFDKSMALLVAENERLYTEVGELRVSERDNHARILHLEAELADAKAQIERRISDRDKQARLEQLEAELTAARTHIAELERPEP